jgi:two-component system phosphate regulon sensor histidine kinase PhoR
MSNTVVRRVLILGAIAMIGIIAMQTYWVVINWNFNDEDFNNKVNLALYRTAQSLAELGQADPPKRDVVNRRTSNYYIVNIENEVNSEALEFFLQRELEQQGLNIDFEYAIFDCHSNAMVYGGFCDYTPEGANSADLELGNLPKDSEFLYYFGVKFPTRSSFLFGKMQLIITLSGVMLVTLAFFAYSMFVILRQKRMSEMQKDFINNMTHEFRTPLSTIRIAANVFQRDPGVQANERLARYANIIHEQYERLNRQVEKVLQIARIERGTLAIKPDWLALDAVLDPLLAGTKLRAEESGGTCEITLPPAPLRVWADRLHFSNILYNLLDNALKYSDGAPQLRVAVEPDGGGLVIRIADQGVGIDPEHQARVFEKFFRVPTGDTHDVKGFGLGLFYVKGICEAHGWRITLDSRPGAGTTVSIFLPSRAVEVPKPTLV